MKIRIIHIVPSLAPGGAERVAATVACGLDRDRFEPVLLSMGDPCHDELPALLKSHDVPLISLGKLPGFSPRMVPRIENVIESFTPDILHTHLHVLPYSYPAALSAKRIPAQIHTVHQVASREATGIHRCLQRFAFRHGVLAVAIAEEVASTFRQLYRMSPWALVPNGIPVARFDRAAVGRSLWRAHEGFSAADVLFVNVAWFRPQKNHCALLQAFALASGNSPQAHLLLAGDGPLSPALQNQAASLGLRDRVHFLGLRQDIPELLAASDVFVLSSSWEGHPLAVMEAMAAGKPVIATSVGGVPELVETGTQGILVGPADVRGLADAIGHLLDHAEIRRAMGYAAASRARREFDSSFMVRAYENLYEIAAGTPIKPLTTREASLNLDRRKDQ